MKTQRTNSRGGFTAIEILIVVAIIALLMSIVAGAVFRVKSASEKTATETTLTKLANLFDRHWKATIESAKKEYDGLPTNIKQNLIALADNKQPLPSHPRRDDRARLLYVKFRLKQEFPTSFSDVVLTPLALMTPTLPNFQSPPLSSAPYYFVPPRQLLPTEQLTGITNPTTGKAAYVSFIADFVKKNSSAPNNLSIANVNQYPSPKYQSAILLVLALEQARGGVSPVNLEQEIGTTFVPNGFEDVDAKKAGKTIVLPRFLADTWGNPLQLYIFPTANAVSATDLAYTGTNADPQDPEGLLQPTALSKWTVAINNFGTLLHPQTANRRLIPVIASAGPDGDIGGPSATTGWAANTPSMDLSTPGSFDNIYSFRLRQSGARGD